MALRRGLLRLASSSASHPVRSACRASPSISLQVRLLTGWGGVVEGLQVRDYSTGQAPKKKEPSAVTVPIQLPGIGGRYAAALYKTALQANKLEQVYEELNQILNSADKSPTFAEFLKDKSVTNREKVKIVRALLEELKCTDMTVNFMALLAENGRLHNFQGVMKAVSQVIMAHKKQVKAMVTTVTELKPKEMEDLKKSLKRFVASDHTIVLDQKIDRRIMGGLVVEIGDKFIDLSIATKLKQMERALREPIHDIV